MQTHEVVIVGAGPAGATLARELALAGIETALVERARLPRYKSCAGGVALRTVASLPFSIAPVVEDEVQTLSFGLRGAPSFAKTATRPFAAMVMRDRFDALLTHEAQQAGARLIEGTVVRRIECGRQGFQLDTSSGPMHARLLAGADGANSIVARDSGLGAGLAEATALEAELAAPEAALERWRGQINIDLGYRPSGYGWLFPKARLLSAGLVLPQGQSARLREGLRAYLEHLHLGEARIERLTGHKVRFRRGKEPIAGDGALLLGDAAGLVDEFTEEGIFYAIRSGQIAARFLQRAAAGDHRWLGAYQHAIDRELMPELRAARTIARLFYGSLSRAPGAMMRFSARVDYLWRAFFRVQWGESSYEREVRRARLVRPLARLVLR